MNKILALIEVRKMIALAFAALFIYLMIVDTVSVDQGLPLITMAIGYYFGKSTALDKPEEDNNAKNLGTER